MDVGVVDAEFVQSATVAGSVTGGAAIVAGSVYWGWGYRGTECFTTANPLNNDKLYAFGLH